MSYFNSLMVVPGNADQLWHAARLLQQTAAYFQTARRHEKGRPLSRAP
jgi:hypothetical protein